MTDALDVDGPVVTVGHDWGGVVSLGWALRPPRPAPRHRARQHRGAPAGTPPCPALIRLARAPALRHAACAVHAGVRPGHAARCPGRRCPPRCATPSPRRTGRRRGARAVGDFVADIPLDADAPERARRSTRSPTASRDARRRPGAAAVGTRATRSSPTATCATCAPGCRTPTCTASRAPSTWCRRTPGRRRRRVRAWLAETVARRSAPPHGDLRPPATRRRPPLWAGARGAARTTGRRRRRAAAAAHGLLATCSPAASRELAAGPRRRGVARRRPGRAARPARRRPHRRASTRACGSAPWSSWPTRGSAAAGLARALRGAGPTHVIGVAPRRWRWRPAAAAARASVAAGPARRALRRALGVAGRPGRARRPRPGAARPPPRRRRRTTTAAVLFTSGATGPAKGVVYTPPPGSRPSATPCAPPTASPPTTGSSPAFPPFALLGPALGHRLGRARHGRHRARHPDRGARWPTPRAAVDATVVFASPAALRERRRAPRRTLDREPARRAGRRPAGPLRRRAGARGAARTRCATVLPAAPPRTPRTA